MPNRINHFRGNLQQLVRKTYQVIFALSINLGMTTEFRKAGPATVHIANPAAFIAQKLLISARRPAGDRAKDILYIHRHPLYTHTIETFGSSLDQIRTEWHDDLRKQLHSNAIRSINQTIRSMCGEGE